MIGAAVIWLEVIARPRGRLWPEIMAVAGLGMIIVPYLAYTDYTPFPFPGPVVRSWTGAATPSRVLLGRRP